LFPSEIDAQSIETSSFIQESVALSKEVSKQFKIYFINYNTILDRYLIFIYLWYDKNYNIYLIS